MKLLNWAAALVVAAAVCGSSAFLFAAQDKAADDAKPAAAQEKADKPAKKMKAVRLTKPWNQIESLSEEQKTKIGEIHKKALDEIKAIQLREHEEIMAVLDDEQKAQITKMKEDAEAARKTKKGGAAKKGEEAAE